MLQENTSTVCVSVDDGSATPVQDEHAMASDAEDARAESHHSEVKNCLNCDL